LLFGCKNKNVVAVVKRFRINAE